MSDDNDDRFMEIFFPVVLVIGVSMLLLMCVFVWRFML